MLSEEAVFYTQISAYLIVVYLVGAKLTRLQISLVNFLFIVATVFGIFGVVSFTSQIARLVELSGVTVGYDVTDNSEFVLILFRSLLLVGSLVFMWEVRHPRH